MVDDGLSGQVCTHFLPVSVCYCIPSTVPKNVKDKELLDASPVGTRDLPQLTPQP